MEVAARLVTAAQSEVAVARSVVAAAGQSASPWWRRCDWRLRCDWRQRRRMGSDCRSMQDLVCDVRLGEIESQSVTIYLQFDTVSDVRSE